MLQKFIVCMLIVSTLVLPATLLFADKGTNKAVAREVSSSEVQMKNKETVLKDTLEKYRDNVKVYQEAYKKGDIDEKTYATEKLNGVAQILLKASDYLESIEGYVDDSEKQIAEANNSIGSQTENFTERKKEFEENKKKVVNRLRDKLVPISLLNREFASYTSQFISDPKTVELAKKSDMRLADMYSNLLERADKQNSQLKKLKVKLENTSFTLETARELARTYKELLKSQAQLAKDMIKMVRLTEIVPPDIVIEDVFSGVEVIFELDKELDSIFDIIDGYMFPESITNKKSSQNDLSIDEERLYLKNLQKDN